MNIKVTITSFILLSSGIIYTSSLKAQNADWNNKTATQASTISGSTITEATPAPATPSTPRTHTTLTYVKKDVKIDKYYTKEELAKIPKLELRNIYKKRINYIIEVLPFISLHKDPGATLFEMGIPETEANIKHLDKEIKNKQMFLNSLYLTLDDIIPYY